ncbi:hypothetical protein [Mucilaginibacter sp. 44-25]|uniref:hypothetical protein n=1 Tax=Mucilaginibacter sp. 44-25 TaxID=1895794 RepID=UPI0009664631|nr:hypothetical protein [Mucilaginibacter sp. 44-25]OJW12605.1 MAG: hypothetical protein BGO48_05850 [Mucilaginibacter sp. 44-25]
MSTIEEKLWDYIDGNCTPQEADAVKMLIETDEVYRKKYNELQVLNSAIVGMEEDEPSMAFTYNVMECIRAEEASVPLKARVDRRIIWGISLFFILTIAVMLVYALSTIKLSAPGKLTDYTKVPVSQLNGLFTGPIGKGFLFFDMVMGLFVMDKVLRRRGMSKG